MEINSWGRPVFKSKYIGSEQRGDVVVFKFTRPATNISGVKTYESKGYIVGFVSWFNNLYVEYIAVDTKTHGDPVKTLKNRASSIINDARNHGWNKRLTAEVEAITTILKTLP